MRKLFLLLFFCWGACNTSPSLLGQAQLEMDIEGEAAGDESGYSVSLSADGSRVAIGAPSNDGNGLDAGHVRIYEIINNTWIQIGNDIDGEAIDDQSGWTVSLSADGSRVAVGAPFNDGNGSNSGHVRIYEWNGSDWTQVGTDIDGEAAGDESGYSVSLSADGSRVAIGAPSNDGNGLDAGHVRIYDWNGSDWTQVGTDIDGEAVGDKSGHAVSLSADGSRVAIGAPFNGGNGFNSGHVRVYNWNSSAWGQMGMDIDVITDSPVNNRSGWAVSLSTDGNRIAVGSPLYTLSTQAGGRSDIYEWNSSNWIAKGHNEGGHFMGLSVSISGDGNRVAHGGFGPVIIDDYNCTSFQYSGILISQELLISHGYSVSLSADGSRVAIGAPFDYENGFESGLVRIYSLPLPSSLPSPVANCQPVIVDANANCEGIAEAVDFDNNSTAPDGSMLLYSVNPEGPYALGTTNVTLTVEASCGEPASCTTTITVTDNTPPLPDVVNLPDVTLECQVEVPVPTATDNCGGTIQGTTTDPTSYEFVGTYQVNWTYDDGNGNTSTQIQTIIIENTTPPIAICANITVELDDNCSATVTGEQLGGQSPIPCCINFEISLSSLLGNGSFEPDDNGDTGTIDPWTGVGNHDNHNHTNYGNPTHAVLIDPVTAVYEPTPVISQTATVTPGETYVVSGTFCGYNAYDAAIPDNLQLTVNANDYQTAMIDVEPINFTQWNTFSYEFTATEGTADVNLGVIDTYNVNGVGVMVDNVTLTPTTPPAVDLPATFDASHIGVNEVNVTITVPNGNSNSCIAVVTVEDNTLPVANCQDVTIQLDANNTATVLATDIDANSTDNCGTVLLTLTGTTSYTCDDVGQTFITELWVEDVGGNVSFCAGNVTVADDDNPCNQPPVANCQTVSVDANANCEGEAVAADFDNNSIDPDGDALLYSISPAGPYAIGTTNVTLTVDDQNGETASCSTTITVTDNATPVAMCEDLTVELDANCSATVTADQLENGSTDNCGVSTIEISLPSLLTDGSFTIIGNVGGVDGVDGSVGITNPWTGVDGNYTAIDHGNPTTSVLIDPITTVYNPTPVISQTATLTPGETYVVAGTFCGYNAYDAVVPNDLQLTVNAGTYQAATIDVLEPNFTQWNTFNYEFTAVDVTTDINFGVIDATNIDGIGVMIDNVTLTPVSATVIGDPVTFDASHIGQNDVNVTVTDIYGNENSCVAVVTVEDNIAPTPDLANLPDATGECDASVTAPTATDNCAGAITATTTDPTSYSDQGTYQVTWTYDDGNGNVSTQTQNVIVEDVTAPVADVANLPDATGECAASVSAPTATDNCAGSITATTNDPTSYNAQGTYQVTWTYDDGNGNVSTQTQNVIVDDMTAPVADVANLPDATGECAASVTAPTATDNCAGAITATTNDPTSYNAQGTYQVTWTYDDGNGNVSTQTQNVIVDDMTAPVADVANLPDATGECAASVTAPTATDNCAGAITATTNDPTSYNAQGTYQVTWTYDDGNGNVSTQTQNVIVDDVTAPTANCQDVAIVLDAAGNGSIATTDINNGSNDNCTSVEWLGLSLDQTAFDCSHVGSNTVTLTVDDNNGNIATCTATVNVTGLDADGDGFSLCEGDTHDDDPDIYPGAPELCDGIDNDLDGSIDEPHNVSSEYEWIDAVEVNDLNNISGDNFGYADFTNMTATLSTGEYADITLTPGYAGASYPEKWRVYIDFNQDGIFDHPSERVVQKSGHYTQYGSIYVPMSAMTGTTRMRVIMSFNGHQFPCNDNFEGEVEDYTVNIVACDNVTDGGMIGEDEVLCPDMNDPAAMIDLVSPSGGSGTLEYLWMKNTLTSTPPIYNLYGWEEIPNSNSASYDPGPISQTTWYVRCVRRNGCMYYAGESNVIEKTFNNNCPGDYCEITGESTQYEWIKKVKVGAINNLSGNDNGYGDYTNLSTNLAQGQTKYITLKPGFSGSSYYEYWKVWVDWNQDGDFDDWGELQVQDASYGTVWGYICAPTDAAIGTTRMRVAMSYGDYPWACENFSEGEVEDYTINITGGQGLVIAPTETLEELKQREADELVLERDAPRIATNIDLNVYPNPASQYLNIQIEGLQAAATIVIYDSVGKLVWTQEQDATDTTLTIDLDSRFSKGIYLVHVIAGEQKITKRVAVIK